MEMPRANQSKHFAIILAVALGLAVLILVASRLENQTDNLLMREGGIVETLSAAGYFLCVLVMLMLGGFTHLKKFAYLHVLLLALGLRELDFHDRFTTMGMFKLRFFTSAEVPGIEKCISIAVILFLIFCVVLSLKKHFANFAKALRSFEPGALSLAIAVFLVGFSKSIDGLARKLRGISVELSEQATRFAIILEEILELGIPLFMLAAILIYFSQQKTRALIEETPKVSNAGLAENEED